MKTFAKTLIGGLLILFGFVSSIQAQVAPPSPVDISLMQGWNLKGNSSDVSIDVPGTFGGLSDVATVWKWDSLNKTWLFYTASLDSDALATYAAAHNYGVLNIINPGEGFWVSSGVKITVPLVGGNVKVIARKSVLEILPAGWSLLAVSLKTSLSGISGEFSDTKTPPSAGSEMTSTIKSVWSWDTASGNWYFYSREIEAGCSAAAVAVSATSTEANAFFDSCIRKIVMEKGYLDSADKWIGPGEGFWVNNQPA